MHQQALAGAVTLITSTSQYGLRVSSWKCHQGIYDFIVRDLPAGKDKAKESP